MNARTLPLSAFLMTAALSAAAQPGSLMGSTGNPFAPNGSGYGSFNVGAPDAKSPLNVAETFTCVEAYIVPKPCTREQVKYRNGVLASLRCPEPFIDACKNFLLLNGPTGSQASQGMDPLTQPDEFYKKCGTIPYRACTPKEAAEKEKWLSAKKQQAKPSAKGSGTEADPYELPEIVVTGRRQPAPTQHIPQPGDADFIGPLPEGMQMNASANWNNQFEAIKEKNPDAINVGNEKYIYRDPNNAGMVQECGAMTCRRVPASQYQAQLDAADAGSANLTNNSVPNKPPKENVPPVVGQQNPVNPNPGAGASASQDGNDVAATQRAIGASGDNGTPSSSVSSGGYGMATAGGGQPEGNADVTTAGSEIAHPNDIQLTFNNAIKAQAIITDAQAEVDSGVRGAPLVTTDGRTGDESRQQLKLGENGRPALISVEPNGKKK